MNRPKSLHREETGCRNEIFQGKWLRHLQKQTHDRTRRNLIEDRGRMNKCSYRFVTFGWEWPLWGWSWGCISQRTKTITSFSRTECKYRDVAVQSDVVVGGAGWNYSYAGVQPVGNQKKSASTLKTETKRFHSISGTTITMQRKSRRHICGRTRTSSSSSEQNRQTHAGISVRNDERGGVETSSRPDSRRRKSLPTNA